MTPDEKVKPKCDEDGCAYIGSDGEHCRYFECRFAILGQGPRIDEEADE